MDFNAPARDPGRGTSSTGNPGGRLAAEAMRLFFVFRAAWHKYPAAVSVLVVVEQYIFIASVDAIAFVRLQHHQSIQRVSCTAVYINTVPYRRYLRYSGTVGTMVP